MCTSSVGRVLAVEGHHADVAVQGRCRRISLAPLTLDGVDVAPGAHVLVHAGLALALVSAEEATALEQLPKEVS